MAKATNRKQPEIRAEKYEEKVSLNNTSEDMTGRSLMEAEKKSQDKQAGNDNTKKLEDQIDLMNKKKEKEIETKKSEQRSAYE